MEDAVPGTATMVNKRSDASFPPELRNLLAAAPTVTAALEARHRERIRAVALTPPSWIPATRVRALAVPANERVLLRRTILEGRTTHQPFVVAESAMVPGRLAPSVTHDLEHTDLPIGEVLGHLAILPVRDALGCGEARLPEDAARRTGKPPAASFPVRTDRLLIDGIAVMIVTEWFLPACTDDLRVLLPRHRR